MATYKVPQNVEAEDKLLGPFSFKQFIYLMIASFAVFIAWLLSRINGWLVVLPLPVITAFAILGLYHREDQPVETYLLAAINFLIKPRRRLWNPEGNVENVKITAPKKMATPSAKQLERGQLERLAHVVDTRGWYVKRPELQEPLADTLIDDDDRLINPATQVSPTEAPIHEIDDMLGNANPEVEDFQNLAEQTHTDAVAHAKAQMKKAAQQPSKLDKKSDLPTTNSQLPTNVHYDPYPQGVMRELDPATGQYHPVVHAQAVKQLPKNLPVSEVAKVVNRPAAKQGESVVAGKEVQLR